MHAGERGFPAADRIDVVGSTSLLAGPGPVTLDCAKSGLRKRRPSRHIAIMRLEHESSDDVKARVRAIVEQHLDLRRYRVFFFGSRVSGKGDERSDIDIGIDGSEAVPGDVFEKLRDALAEIPILYTIDLVDLARASERFRRVALEAIEEI